MTRFDYAKTVNLLVSNEGYGEVYNMNTVNKIERIIVFRVDFTNFPSSEPQLTQAFQNELVNAVSQGSVKDTKLAQMIFSVDDSF